jgi:hypothetical protein
VKRVKLPEPHLLLRLTLDGNKAAQLLHVSLLPLWIGGRDMAIKSVFVVEWRRDVALEGAETPQVILCCLG